MKVQMELTSSRVWDVLRFHPVVANLRTHDLLRMLPCAMPRCSISCWQQGRQVLIAAKHTWSIASRLSIRSHRQSFFCSMDSHPCSATIRHDRHPISRKRNLRKPEDICNRECASPSYRLCSREFRIS